MKFLEKDLERIIYETPKDKLNEKGLFVDGHVLRQVKIPNYGIADIVTVKRVNSPVYPERYLHFTIYELKKDRIGISSFLQAVGYVRGIKAYLEKRISRDYFLCDFSIVLVGSEIDKTGNFMYLPCCFDSLNEFEPKNSVSNVYFYTYKYDFDGISFEQHYY